MSTKAKLIKKLRKSKEYRDAFVDAEFSIGIPFQIRALREQRKWSQGELAQAAGMKQPRISAMEKAGYGALTLKTLKTLAAAFDVGLVVRFAPFGEMVEWADSFSPDTFQVPSAADDPTLSAASEAIQHAPPSATTLPAQSAGSAGQTADSIIVELGTAHGAIRFGSGSQQIHRRNDAISLGLQTGSLGQQRTAA